MSVERICGICACMLALNWPQYATAQDTVTVYRRGSVLDASSRVARDAVRRFNARSTTRVFGSLTITRDDVYNGDVAVLDGPIRVSGTIRGDLVAINSDVSLSRTAFVQGNIIVLGGDLTGIERARVRGNTRRHPAQALVRRSGNQLVLIREREPVVVERPRLRPRRHRSQPARTSLVVSLGNTYNRVEGLPIHLGPRIEWGPYRTRFRVEAVGIVRTEGDLKANREDLGYDLLGEVRVGNIPAVTVGARGYDVVAPIEDWQLHTDEIGLASLLWHRDFRDYYLRRGIAGFIHIEPMRSVTISAEVARNYETSIAARDPWTPFRQDELWRANPAIDEGHFTSITVGAEYDSRPFRRVGASGWLLRAEWERGLSDDIVPEPLPATIRGPIPIDGSYTFDRLFVDLRRYERIGWRGQLSLRAVAAGTVGDDPLPIQRRLSLGGPDPMPGFGFRHVACNKSVLIPAIPALCDRLLLFQAEYRGSLSFNAPWSDRQAGQRSHHGRRRDLLDLDDWLWFDGPTFVLFGNAGTGWLRGDDIGKLQGDVGVGLEFGSAGFYAARALTEGEPIRLTLRIHRRF
jgi:hypothetical protein